MISLSGYRRTCDERKIQHRVVGSHVLSALSSISSILPLTERLSVQVREAVLLSRGIYETLLAGAFCSIDNGASANRAILRSINKTVRSQNRHTIIGPIQIMVSRPSCIDRNHPKMVEAIKIFGGSSNIRPCFPKTRAQMISAIADRDKPAGSLFSGVEAMIYDIGSEIIYGLYYAWDTFNTSPNGELERLQKHYQMRTTQCSCLLLCFADPFEFT